MADPKSEEIVFPFPDTLSEAPLVVECRSTLLMASLQAVKKRGRLDDYKRLVDPKVLEEITSAVAAVWLPIEFGVAHYRTCDALGFSTQEQLDLGGEVIARLQETFIGALLRAARKAGIVTPWVGVTKFAQIYARSFRGGGARVVKLGPKEARIEVVGQPLAAIPYFRVAHRGLIRAGTHFFAAQAFCNDVQSLCTSTTLGYRLVWA